ncbi:transcriptional repressor [Magnetospira sp. QH-2]|uniref:transcriptional repressor n=1 Tax=Magnetospira sp. (strain QH-2) TaxID=1288970 RepID=UPI0003E8195D|nr:transcriptional repressor [Magnetospira sp. QH-2]CCQ74258.1 Zinc uptake regulation protein; Fur family [Magnetospira sp. QH-2]
MSTATIAPGKDLSALRSDDPWSRDNAAERAEELCAHRGVRLTPLRRWVLERLWEDRGRPKGAYELLEELKQEKGNAAPPTVYRALDFLLEQGLIHKLESLNSFIACNRPEKPHVTRFLLCQDCGVAEEIGETLLDEALGKAAERVGFEIQEGTIEIVGRCVRFHQGKTCDKKHSS